MVALCPGARLVGTPESWLPWLSLQLMPVSVSLPVFFRMPRTSMGRPGAGALLQLTARLTAGTGWKKPKSILVSLAASPASSTVAGLGLLSRVVSLPARTGEAASPAGGTTSTR